MSKTKGDVLALYWKISYTFMIMNLVTQEHSDDLSTSPKKEVSKKVDCQKRIFPKQRFNKGSKSFKGQKRMKGSYC